MTQPLSIVGVEGNLLNLIKVITQNPKVSIIFSSQVIKTVSLKLEVLQLTIASNSLFYWRS